MSIITGKRVLVLEDDVLLALDAADALEEMGVDVIGPVHRVAAALAILDNDRPDAALLDVNIAGTTSAEVARRLVANGIPFVLATGYGSLSGIEGSSGIIDKPYNHQQLGAAMSRLFADDAAQPLRMSITPPEQTIAAFTSAPAGRWSSS